MTNREDLLYEKIMARVHEIKNKESFLQKLKKCILLPFEIIVFELPIKYKSGAILAVAIGFFIGFNTVSYKDNTDYTYQVVCETIGYNLR
jgi:hypothetical protein